MKLTYRGVSYEYTPPQVAYPEPKAEGEMQGRARELMMRHSRSIKKRQQTLLWRSADEAGVHGNLSEYWNRIQGKVHSTFRTTYDRSAATMS